MLPLKNRLRKKEDFQKVYQKGFFSALGDISLKKAPNTLALTRIGFIVEKKFFKKAVHRNRIKRILRAFAQKNISLVSPGLDVVIFYRSKEKEIDSKKITSDLEKLFKKTNILK
jgi:ribonuclease P protein component